MIKQIEKSLLKMIYKARKPVSYFGDKVYKGSEALETYRPYMFEALLYEGLVTEYKMHHFKTTDKGSLYLSATAKTKTKCQTQGLEYEHIYSSFSAG